MYKTYYGLKSELFPKDLDTKEYYKSQNFIEDLNRLEFLKEAKGFGLITEKPRVEKSFLLRHFTNSLNINLFKQVYIPISTSTFMDFYRTLCHGLGIFLAHKKVLMFPQIQESIYTYSVSKDITPIIIIDETQLLKNSVLDDLRLILNFDMDSKDHAILILSRQAPFIT